MAENDLLHPVRRFLHICYVCRDVDGASRFLSEAFGMREVMRTPEERTYDELLGMEREVVSPTAFVYDFRGPRVSPSVEVQQYIEPATTGTPSFDPFEIGLKAFGVTVPNTDEAVATLIGLGAKVTSTGSSPFGTTWTTVVDPNDITWELIEDPSLAGPAQLRHLRITVSDLSTSIPWYENLGFRLLGTTDIDGASFLGVSGTAKGTAARLRLPDEPFEVVLIEWSDPMGHGAHYPVPYHAGLFRCALQVFDTVAATEAMKANGTEFVRGPIRITLNVAAQIDMTLSFLADPDGILYEFVGRPEGILKVV